jgi:hypothetical protein
LRLIVILAGEIIPLSYEVVKVKINATLIEVWLLLELKHKVAAFGSVLPVRGALPQVRS